jgi:hypothetical protein
MSGELTFFRWARLRDFSDMGLALRRSEVEEFIRDGYLERTESEVIVSAQGKEALLREPAG